jgi:formiminotetrahydrofolate cyclodeaminase
MALSVWDDSIAAFGSALAEPQPMPAGVAAAAVTASLGLALFLKVLAIAAKKQPIPGLAGAARRHLLDLEVIVEADAAAYQAFRNAPPKERPAVSAEAVRIPLTAARSAVGGLELCAQAHKQVSGLIEADLLAAAHILYAAAKATLGCADANLRLMPLMEETRLAYLADSRHIAEKADTAFALILPTLA